MVMARVSLLLFLLASCSSASILTGYHENEKPYKGTNWQNKDYVRQYWQCVRNNINVDCDVE